MAFALFLQCTKSSLFEAVLTCFSEKGLSWSVSTDPIPPVKTTKVGEIQFWQFPKVLVLGFSSHYVEKRAKESTLIAVEDIVEFVIKSGECDCLFLTMWEDFIWQYELFESGIRTTRFVKYAGYFDELNEGSKGDPKQVAELFGVSVSTIAPYHRRVVTDENEGRVLLDSESPIGLSNHNQPSQAFDFAEEIGASIKSSEVAERWVVYSKDGK